MADNRAKWPEFVTRDLGDSAQDGIEMERRWAVYRDQMAALIAAGGVRKDDDGWWVDDATGALIGPDPAIERPLTESEMRTARSFTEMFPDFAESLTRKRGPQKAPTKVSTTLRLSQEVVNRFRAMGPGWQTRIDAALKEWLAAQN